MKEFAGEEYEDDSAQMGPSYFYQPSEKWACSTTGDYLETNITNYITSNNALNTTVPEIYRTARLAPLSLRYYGICLLKGVYTVKLHFAEIMYTDDHTFNSVGERIFDVLIQGQMRLKDFNIAKEAKGFGRDTVREFNDIIVSGSTLEIHLYWAGKGTTFVPARGVYGPLISAIAVTRNPDHGHSIGATLGVVAAVCMVIVLIVMFVWVKCHQKGKYLEDEELRHLKLQKGYFTLKQIKAATGNFDSANKIGEGGFGPVYKGILPDGTAIAVKQLSSKSMQGNREFMNEIGMLSALQHPNLVKLFGCCVEGNQLLLIYEYMENNSLAHALFGKEEHQPNLDWPTRHKICLGMARGLAYLHEESRLKIVHRDIKTTNVLLDKDLNAKISDFGLAKLDEKEKTHIITRIAGTIGYMAPEYATRGYLTDKADVYSFGVVMLETVSGKSNTSHLLKEDFVQLLDWAYALQERGNLLHLVDPILESNYSKEEAMTMLNLALLCTNPSPSLRPLMSTVVRMLEGKISVQESLHKQGSVKEGLKFKAFELVSHDNYSQSQSNVSGTSQGSWIQNSTSVEGSWVDSSVSFENKEESRVFSAGSRLLA
uniref:non-specific serine/threonine protein kinase n=1 Tax=Nelumbo nucifera TaxID=4432 RepID=A0A822YZQ7_NELNU|nr:TPA_asm: hypothetical protein HUJ06_008374 [Nelumbo nucifera]